MAFALQAAQTLNIPIPGGRKYNVPTVNITISSEEPPTSPSSYSQMAIAGADDFVDGDVTIKDVFDVIVSNTRELTPACKFSLVRSRLAVRFADSPPIKSEPYGHLGTCKVNHFPIE